MNATGHSLDEVQLLRRELGELRELVPVLRAQIEWLKQQLFGPGKSERLDRAQLLLKLEALEQLSAKAERPVEKITYERAAGPAPKRTLPSESFAQLPVEETVVIEPEAVKADRSLYERIGEDAHVRGRCGAAAAVQARDRASEVSASLGPEPGAVVGAGSEACGQWRLRLGGIDRVGADREILRPPTSLQTREDAGAVGRSDLAAELERVGRDGERSARAAGQSDEARLAGQWLRAGR